MLWMIQGDAPRTRYVDAIVPVLERHAIPYALVDVMPDGWEAAADALADGRNDVCVYGTTRMTRHARSRWSPGAFVNGDFTFDACLAGWGEEMLNADARVMRLGDAEFDGVMFVRPQEDSKLFSGEIVDGRRLSFWKELRLSENRRLTPDSLIVAAGLKPIESETRCFVVDGQVVTSSRYVSAGMLSEGPADPDVVAYARRMVDRWRPHDNFVLDIAVSAGRHRIIEVNCINSSGMYACDPEAIMLGLTRYVRDRVPISEGVPAP
mgnify:CR=1 FL=1|jgi:hypothetical protein